MSTSPPGRTTVPAIRPGTREDYLALARFHYRAGEPATVAAILTAADRGTGEPAAVLVVSYPALNARWRRVAWPGCYDPGALGHSGAARRLNAEVRTISRVIVDPRWRGLGLGSALVRTYLASPRTPRTEALAAMARFCPLFERAGMRPVPLAHDPTRADTVLRAAIHSAGLEPWMLVSLPRARRTLGRRPAIARALRTWAHDKHARTGARRAALLALAAASLESPPIAFVHP